MYTRSTTHSISSPASFDPAMARHDGLVQVVVRRQWGGNLSFAERLQAGRIGLWQALRHFDPQRGYAFSSYAYPAIARAVWREVARAQAPPLRPLPLSLPCLEAEGADYVGGEAVRRCLGEMLDRLPRPLRQVVVLYFGLDGQPAHSLRQLAPILGISHEMVRLRLQAALVRLRQPANSLRLRQLLGRNTVADYEYADALAQAFLRRRGGHHDH